MGYLLEFLFRIGFFVHIGVQLAGKLPVGTLDVLSASLAVNSQDLVVVNTHSLCSFLIVIA